MAFDWYQNVVTLNDLNGVMAVILRYSTEFGSFGDQLRQSD